MDKDRIKGSAKQVVGNVTASVGKALGNSKMEANGRAKSTVGRIQNAFGGVKDKVRTAFKKV